MVSVQGTAINEETGLCRCGCGQRTNIHNESHPSRGIVNGAPKKYIFGHRRKERRANYVKISVPSHPQADSQGYVYEHRLIAEAAFGKYLPPHAIVHHINGNTHDNRNQNLVVLENHTHHSIVHDRQRALRECGHANWRKCCFCHQYDDPQNLHLRAGGKSVHHRLCYNAYMRNRKHLKLVQSGGTT